MNANLRNLAAVSKARGLDPRVITMFLERTGEAGVRLLLKNVLVRQDLIEGLNAQVDEWHQLHDLLHNPNELLRRHRAHEAGDG